MRSYNSVTLSVNSDGNAVDGAVIVFAVAGDGALGRLYFLFAIFHWVGVGRKRKIFGNTLGTHGGGKNAMDIV